MQSLTVSLAEGTVHFLVDIAMKHDKTQGLRVRSSEVRWENSRAPGASQNAKTENEGFTRQATQGRGGFKRSRAFRRALVIGYMS